MNQKPIESICVLRLSAIGDVCNAVSAVQAIQKEHPSAKITWVIGKPEYELLSGLPGIEFIVFDKRAGKKAVREFKRTMSDRRFDLLLLMQVAMRANLLSRHIKANRRIGFDKGRSKELHSLFINERIKAPSRHHVLEGFMAFAKHLGVAEDYEPSWNIPLVNLEDGGISPSLPKEQFAVIAPCASNPERNWLPQRYAQIADFVAQSKLPVLLCGGPSEPERVMAERIQDLCETPLTNLVGKTSLKELLAILKKATFALCPDTGPLHMAVSQGTKVVGLYGHSNPARTGPYNSLDFVVEAYHSNLRAQTGKDADNLPWGKRVKGENVMSDITVDEVKLKIRQLMKHLENSKTN